ncbi:MAG: 4-hydroxy-3-methylbut-2-enyl diphosphate reductase, partial [Armatimonadetes bacterium]|nr:4-hydroxy-3-methylbut-2-enyl diphosphate reductase [Armatimonadota bacterium]
MERIVLAAPRGFCAGVAYAIEVVDLALKVHGTPLYVRHAIVHNEHVVRSFEERGVVFVEKISEIPEGATVIFSAHGISPQVRTEADGRGLHVIDATCPLVTKVHREAQQAVREGKTLILIGHQGHPEVEGTLGQVPPERIHLVETVEDVEALNLDAQVPMAYVTQTTLSMDDTAQIVDALRRKYPSIDSPRQEDICYATQNRQNAVKEISA